MGLISSVDKITRELQENSLKETLREKRRRENEELLKDIEIECNSFIYELIFNDKEDEVILNLDENISIINNNIKNKAELREIDIVVDDNWKKVKRKVKKYNIVDDFEFERVIKEVYYKEYQKVKKELNFKKNIDKNKLEIELSKYFRKAFKVSDNKESVYKQLLKYDIKTSIIDDIASKSTKKYDTDILNSMYNKVLNNVKLEYKSDIDLFKLKNKQKNNNYNGVMLFGLMSLFGINKKYKYKRKR